MARAFIERLRIELGKPDVLAPLVVLGAIAGIAAGALMLLFRAGVEWTITQVVGLDEPEAFESLSATIRFGLPILGALLIALFYERLGANSAQVGITFVMERLAWHQASMPTRNAVAQFFGAIVSLASGHSLGREGPAVHLGAHVSSVIGERLRAPHNTTRILVACGTAAAIAASFNTPIAGVIFAMEVVLLEYTIVGFTPVIVASVTAAWMSRAVYGTAAAFDVPALEMGSLFELPFLIFVGAVIGTLAAAFTWTVANLKQRAQSVRLLWRFLFAGVVTGLCALVIPEVMGLGYDTVEMTFSGEAALGALLAIVAFKWVASATGAAMGLPAGLIGPTLVIGSCAGCALGIVGHGLAPELSASPALYAMLGMGAMMGATLQAPLAALMALLELTANVNIILPGMLSIISATVVCRSLWRSESVFITMLRARGLDYLGDPVAQALSRAGVSSRMRQDVVVVPRHLAASTASEYARGKDRWLVIIDNEENPVALVHAEALATLSDPLQAQTSIDLLEAPLPRRTVATVSMRATLHEAREEMRQCGAQTVCVVRERRHAKPEIRGVLTEAEFDF